MQEEMTISHSDKEPQKIKAPGYFIQFKRIWMHRVFRAHTLTIAIGGFAHKKPRGN